MSSLFEKTVTLLGDLFPGSDNKDAIGLWGDCEPGPSGLRTVCTKLVFVNKDTHCDSGQLTVSCTNCSQLYVAAWCLDRVILPLWKKGKWYDICDEDSTGLLAKISPDFCGVVLLLSGTRTSEDVVDLSPPVVLSSALPDEALLLLEAMQWEVGRSRINLKKKDSPRRNIEGEESDLSAPQLSDIDSELMREFLRRER